MDVQMSFCSCKGPSALILLSVSGPRLKSESSSIRTSPSALRVRLSLFQTSLIRLQKTVAKVATALLSLSSSGGNPLKQQPGV